MVWRMYRRSVVFRNRQIYDERMDGQRRHDSYYYDEDEDDAMTSTGFTIFNRNLERDNAARTKGGQDR